MASSRLLDATARFAAFAVLGAGGGMLLKDHLVDITPINGTSMNPTLSPTVHETGRRDWIAWKMWKPTADLRAGDLVLFLSPSNPESVVVKRVIALGGDTVLLDEKRQPGYGKPANELQPEQAIAAERWRRYDGKLKVPFGHLWVEGDNWAFTRDSNDYGPVSKSLVLGKAWVGIWPWKICFGEPWHGYKSMTKTVEGNNAIPQQWLD